MFGIIFCAVLVFFIFLFLFIITFIFNHGLRLRTQINVPFCDKTYFTTEHIYLVTFITGQRPCAGTQADIYLRLHGECVSSDIFKLDDLSKGHFQRCAIDRFLIFTKESLGHIVRVEIQVDAHGRRNQDWFLTEVIVQDPQHQYRPYIFTCCQWFKGGACTYKHFIVGPKDHRSSYLRTFFMSLTRGLTRYHLWLAVIFDNRHGRRFNGCTASVILFQLLCNLLVFNLVPAVIPDHITHGDLVYYAFPFNAVAFIIGAIMEIISRNIRPRIACICPFHHDWDAERVAYRNSVKIEIARKPLKFKPHPTYESLLKCLTQDDWKRARGVARDVWKKIRSDTITDEILDDIIKAFLYRSAQKISKGAAYEDEKLRTGYDSGTPAESGSEGVKNKNANADTKTFQMAMHDTINNMEIDFAEMLREMEVRPYRSNERDPYVLTGRERLDQPWFSKHYCNEVKGGYGQLNKNCNAGGYDADSSQESITSEEFAKPTTPLITSSPKQTKSRNSASPRTSSSSKQNSKTVLNRNTNASGAYKRARQEINEEKYVPDPNDKETVVIYTIKDGEKMPGEDDRVHKSRVLFMSDLEFIIKSPCKDTLACIKLHNALSKAVAYEVRANNPTVYEIQPNIGLIQPRKTVDICIWLTQGYDVKVLDSILITARPVDAYYCDPSQIRWLWKTAHKSTVLQYALHCRGIIPRKIKEPLDLTTEHLLQLELEMNGEHTKFFVPWTLYPLYLFCGLQGVIALLLAVHYSLGMGSEEVTEWAELFGVAVLQHIFGFEILKLIMLAMLATLWRKNWLVFT